MQVLTRVVRRQARFFMCSENKPEPPKEQPSLAFEIFQTVKESAQDSVARRREAIAKQMHSIKKQSEAESTAKMAFNLAKLAWRKTFPQNDEEVRQKMEKIKAEMAERKQQEEKLKQYSEEELLQMQDQIPEWKKTALATTADEGTQEKPSLRKKIQQKISQRIQQTELAKNIQESEEFKEAKTFQTVMKQFKEDVTERVQNHPSNLVQGSIFLYKTVTNESDTAKAVKHMRLIDPDFDLYEFEKDAKIIFENTYSYYLRSEPRQLEKVCGEVALAYFKVLLKKQIDQKSEPKYKNLVYVDDIRFSKAFVPDSTKLPVFIFTIKTQEIFCYVSNTDKNKIVDGDDDRIMSIDYQFALTPHMTPAVDEVGHSWEMIELQPQMVVKMLV